MKDITLCIIDDNPDLCHSLEEMIKLSDGYRCIGTFNDADKAISNIPRLRPDVVLMDINLGSAYTGIDCVRVLKPHLPDTNFLMCTVYQDDENIFEALKCGASGYILKKTEPLRLLSAIRELYEGGSPVSSEIAKKIVLSFQQNTAKKNQRLNKLTDRQMQILRLLAEGLSYKEIAAKVFLSIETVRKHAYHVYNKLQVTNRISAVNKLYER
jgi:DNA-binding NarL/FixJ family response regulator